MKSVVSAFLGVVNSTVALLIRKGYPEEKLQALLSAAADLYEDVILDDSDE